MSVQTSMTRTQFPTLRHSFEESLAAIYSNAKPLMTALRTAKKAASSKQDGDHPLTDRPITLGQVFSGMAGIPCSVTWLSEVGPLQAELAGVPIQKWDFAPEDSFCIQLFGAYPKESPPEFFSDCFDTAERSGAFEVSYRVIKEIKPEWNCRPLEAASSVFSNLRGCVDSLEHLEKIRTIIGVSGYIFGSLQRRYCGRRIKQHSGSNSGSIAREHCTALGNLIKDEATFESAVNFIELYLQQLATHGANHGEAAALWAQTGCSQFNPIASLVDGLNNLGHDAHGGAQSDVYAMILDCKEFLDAAGWNLDNLVTWGNRWKKRAVFYGYGHRKYRTGDPRGRRMLLQAASDETIMANDLFKFVTWLLETMPKALEVLVPNMESKNENVDFLAAALQMSYLNIRNPTALELLFGLARVPAYTKASFVGHMLKIAIHRPDGLLMDRMCNLTGAENPLKELSS